LFVVATHTDIIPNLLVRIRGASLYCVESCNEVLGQLAGDVEHQSAFEMRNIIVMAMSRSKDGISRKASSVS
jgi:hypothetical protein